MATIKGNGVPTRTTKGAIGDKYQDTTTGKMYVCTNAFRDSVGTAEYSWRIVDKIPPITLNKPTVKPQVEKKPEPVVVEEPTVVEEEPEVSVEPASQERPRTNYSKPYHKYNKPNKN